MKPPSALALAFLLLALGATAAPETPAAAPAAYAPNWASLDRRPVPAWFAQAKFGIFIHWGVYSVPAWAPADAPLRTSRKYAEWYWKRWAQKNDDAYKYFREFHDKVYGANFIYQDFAPMLKGELFSAEGWADILASSGAKYVVLTSKHHDGFALWPSAHSWNWNSMDIGPHRDICGELGAAVRAKGIRMGYYYSLYEWFHPLYQENLAQYVDEHLIPQMKDLVVRYKPDVLWTDGEWDHPSEFWKSEQFLAWLFNESPVREVVAINDRWGRETRSKHGGYYTTEYNYVHDKVGTNLEARPWEECRGIGQSFGFNRAENLRHYLRSDQLIHLLVEKVAQGGNLLLDIGPTADGRIPVIQQQRLADIGDWLKVNGEAIYDTTLWPQHPPYGKDTTVFFTQKGDSLYALCTRWPTADLLIDKVAGFSSVSLLGSNVTVTASLADGKLRIVPPAINPATVPCQHAWVFKIQGTRSNAGK